MQELSKFIIAEEGMLMIKWEDINIPINLNLSDSKEVIIYKVIRDMKKEIADLQEQLGEIKKGQDSYIKYKFDNISDKDAEHRILSYLKRIKIKVNNVTLFEISQDTNLPANQIEKIVEKFEKEGKIKWVE